MPKTYLGLRKRISNHLNNDEINHPDLSEITETLASTYYANLSIFKSIPRIAGQ